MLTHSVITWTVNDSWGGSFSNRNDPKVSFCLSYYSCRRRVLKAEEEGRQRWWNRLKSSSCSAINYRRNVRFVVSGMKYVTKERSLLYKSPPGTQTSSQAGVVREDRRDSIFRRSCLVVWKDRRWGCCNSCTKVGSRGDEVNVMMESSSFSSLRVSGILQVRREGNFLVTSPDHRRLSWKIARL